MISTFSTRPGSQYLHRFRSNVAAMTLTPDERMVVVLASGKAYISNKKLTRWRLLKPA